MTLLLTSLLALTSPCVANDNAKRLYDDLLANSGYNKLIRPVGNATDTLIVKLGIRLSQLIDIVSVIDVKLSMWIFASLCHCF